MKTRETEANATVNARALETALEIAAITIGYAELIRIALAGEDEQEFAVELKKLRKIIKAKIDDLTEASSRPAAPQAPRTERPAKHRDESPRPGGTTQPTAPD